MMLLEPLRRFRRDVETARRENGGRSDVARELSIAITHLEDAEMRLIRALHRQSRHQADADNAVDKLDGEALGVEPQADDEETPQTEEVK